MINLNSLQYYPYIGPPSTWGGYDVPSTNEICKQTLSMSIGDNVIDAIGRVMNYSTYQYYASRFFTVVDLTGSGFVDNSVVLNIATEGANYSTGDSLYVRFSYDNTNWTSWIQRTWRKAATTEEQNIVLTQNYAGYYFMQMRGSMHFYYQTTPSEAGTRRKTIKFNTDVALEGNLYTLYSSSESNPSISSEIPHTRSNFACAFYRGSHLIYTHNIVANILSRQNNFYCMFANQTNLITAPIYWNCNVSAMTYSGSGGAYNFMFTGCSKLRMGLRNFQIFNGTDSNGTGYAMYRKCYQLRLLFNWFNVANFTRDIGVVTNTSTANVTLWNGTQTAKRRIVLGLYNCNSLTVGYMVHDSVSNWNKVQANTTNALTRWGLQVSTLTDNSAGVLPGNILDANTEWCYVADE